jgi:phenylpropionate dioxygenase-like ring-hydroxylating dioxygenase large terminal subunit
LGLPEWDHLIPIFYEDAYNQSPLAKGDGKAGRGKLYATLQRNGIDYIATVSVINCQADYSYLIENLMGMYHGHLHQDLQAWAAASLETIDEDHSQVHAHYTAQSYYRIDKIWSIS